MSFAHEVKTELCGIETGRPAMKAEAYGMLLFGRNFAPNAISIQTEHDGVAALAAGFLKELFGCEAGVKTAERLDGHCITTLSVENADESRRIYNSFGYDEKTVTLRINLANLENEACLPAFLRGAFLSSGSMVDPEKAYHLEFVTPYLNLSRDMEYLLKGLEFRPKTADRKGNHIIYFKDSGQIEDLLTLMGAMRKSLELMNIKVYKDLRNKANRVTNCETANIGKTVNASADQTEAIHKLARSCGLESLPEDLREVARLRLENPDVSLRELGKLLSTPLSRSGVNHRLQKIMELAKNL